MNLARTVSEGLAARSDEVLRLLLPGGRRVGSEYEAGSLRGEAGSSLKVSLTKGYVWKDFASSEKGGDLLDLWSAVQCGGDLTRAIHEAAEYLGLDVPSRESRQVRRRKERRAAKAVDGLPNGEREDLGKPVGRYVYVDADSEPFIAVFRYDGADGSKQFRQFDIRKRRWFLDRENPLPKPRPLYRLVDLLEGTEPVVLVEGEKCADALEGAGILATTALGGSSGISHADLSPLTGRSIFLWPDNDEAGRRYVEQAATLLQALGCTLFEVDVPSGKPLKWDAADAVAEGMTADEILELVNAARPLNPPPIDIFGDMLLVGVPHMPEGALPLAIELFARDEAARIGIEPGVMALACLTVAAGAIHDRFKLQPKEHDTRWRESARLWLAFVDESGTGKSPVINSVTEPMKDFEWRRRLENEEALRRYRVQQKVYDAALDAFGRKRAKGEEAEEPIEPQRPRAWRRLVQDQTIEGLAEILVDNPSGVLGIYDELTSWIGSFDAYRSSPGKDRALWLELYNGGPKAIDRVRRQLFVPNWSAGLLGAIQPGPMRRLVGKITDDGLLARFVVVFGQGANDGLDVEPDGLAINAYRTTIEALLDQEPEQDVVFRLSPDAQRERRLIEDVVRNVKLLPETAPAFVAHLNKWSGLFARLCLVFHLVDAASQDRVPDLLVSGDTASRVARLLVEYLLPNAARFYADILGAEHLTHARWVAGYVLAHQKERVTAREIGRAYRELRDDPATLQRTMATLSAVGWTTPLDLNGKPPSRWVVDPRVHTIFASRARQEKERREAERRKIAEAVRALGGKEGEAADAL